MPRLIVSGNPHELIEDTVTIGHAPDNMIQIDDPSVSGQHAQLQRMGEIYRLKDLDSTNGTRVNGQIVGEITLRIGDRLCFGKVEARFEAKSRAAQPLPELAAIESKPAETGERPADFANMSPFPSRKKDKDPTRFAVFAAATLALLAFLGSMIAVLLMRATM